MKTEIKTYTKPKDYQKDAEKRSKKGWTVVSTQEHAPRTGVRRFFMLGGLGALVFRPKHQIVVTYQHE